MYLDVESSDIEEDSPGHSGIGRRGKQLYSSNYLNNVTYCKILFHTFISP